MDSLKRRPHLSRVSESVFRTPRQGLTENTPKELRKVRTHVAENRRVQVAVLCYMSPPWPLRRRYTLESHEFDEKYSQGKYIRRGRNRRLDSEGLFGGHVGKSAHHGATWCYLSPAELCKTEVDHLNGNAPRVPHFGEEDIARLQVPMKDRARIFDGVCDLDRL